MTALTNKTVTNHTAGHWNLHYRRASGQVAGCWLVPQDPLLLHCSECCQSQHKAENQPV